MSAGLLLELIELAESIYMDLLSDRK